MPHLVMSPRRVTIGGAATFAGTTPRAIRHYHQIGLLPEPERGADGRRRYGYDDMIRLLWIRKMAEAGISLHTMRSAFDGSQDIEETLGRLADTLAEEEADIKRQRAAVQRLKAVGSPLGLLSSLVTDRLSHLPTGALRSSDLDALLVTERMFGPLGAAVQASRFIALATHPELRAEEDRLDAADADLDDSVDPHDPRVEELAAQHCAHHEALMEAIEADGLDAAEKRLLESHDDGPTDDGDARMSVVDAVSKMPYDFSPARKRCMELTTRLLARQQDAPNGS
ncbi:MerR family transcriptional regulator [Pseudonocardia sp. Ae505_Ps2]|uniref:MerR family transcriptional regulator n=2 Tax=unclassified Pseudonocardia TaxID=2619320 RepID=UPI00094B0879|nr:putative MerR-family transcriptional regulator [Pseudonocardia sp. Ae717_Ps2]